MLAYNALLVLILASIPLAYINRIIERIILIILCVILILFAGTRELGVDRDAYTYLIMVNGFEYYLDALKIGVEPGISFLTRLVKLTDFDTIYALFFLFALLFIPIKISKIAKYSPLPVLSILIYYVYMYFKQDFTAIRVAAAISIFFWAVEDIFLRRWKIYILKILLACCFHTSSGFYFPAYFIGLNQFKRGKYLLALYAVFILSNLHAFDFIATLPLISSVSKIQQYAEKVSNGVVEPFNPHGLLFIFNLMVITIITFFSQAIVNKDKKAIFFIKCVILGNILNFILGPISATLSGRVSDLYLVLMCITYCYFIYFIRPYYMGVIIPIFIALILYWFNMVYNKIVSNYVSWLF